MKEIIALYKTWRGADFAKESILSIYDSVKHIVFTHSNISWNGDVGNTAYREILDLEKEIDAENKFVHIVHNTSNQDEQYNFAFDYIKKNFKCDYIMLIDLDEVWDKQNLEKAISALNNGSIGINAFSCKMYTYIKHPLFRIEPVEPCTPTVFVDSRISTLAGVRGSGVSPKKEMENVYFHHFTGVRQDAKDVFDKIKQSNKGENTPSVSVNSWIVNKWNNLLNEVNLHWTRGREVCWQKIVQVPYSFLPSVITKEKVDSFNSLRDLKVDISHRPLEYHSEYGQDRWLNENIFKNMRNGFFVEFGAYNGLLDSNTLFFEETLGWKGLCIEPNPSKYLQLKENRKCMTLCCGVGKARGTEKFTQINSGLAGWSGITRSIEPQHHERIKTHVKKEEVRQINIEVQTLEEILKSLSIVRVDYMSIDTEGSEYEILSTFPFKKFDVRVLTIENNFDNPEIKKLMLSNGYRFQTKLSIDEVYTK